MLAHEIRRSFLDFFEKKGHKIVASAPMVLKDDPTLMFTNAGMNQFKDIFLGNQEAEAPRVADTQKCLRVSGKHNDLEEVGVDTYHHTMFEMLGNWSFGDYFKKEAIDWAWELLTGVFEIPADRLYATIFEGDKQDGLGEDSEASSYWSNYLPADRILSFSKKDNFWEMGDTGPCGPCSEIHIDLREEEERKKQDRAKLVNQDHPHVIEIWNLVFIQFNRKADGRLEELPRKHVDTGMGFERLCMVLQQQRSTYDTDVFSGLIREVEELSGFRYGSDQKTDIAIRVIIDHIRAVSFSLADGQLPSNTGAGYVIRRILRRAVRYGYSYLNLKDPFFHKLVPLLAEQFLEVFPELKRQAGGIADVIYEEETSFLRTLSSGLKKLQQIEEDCRAQNTKLIDGQKAFELYDTYGFPVDLTRLIASEKGFQVDEAGFNEEMNRQKERSKSAAVVEASDWHMVGREDRSEFVGYEALTAKAHIIRYREVERKGKKAIQLVLDKTPFYAESGGQVGDTGYLVAGEEKIRIFDTKKENDLSVHFADKLPEDLSAEFTARVDSKRRALIANNHTATHLMHAALREILGEHVHQKGSYVGPDHLRFDFSHFKKLEEEEIRRIEQRVNEKIRLNIRQQEDRGVPIQEALSRGAMALFGEKYGEEVRVITFDPDYSVELCGGTHVEATGHIGYFKIIKETAVAAGIRRIEALTGPGAEAYIDEQFHLLREVRELLKQPADLLKGVRDVQEEVHQLRKSLEDMQRRQINQLRAELKHKVKEEHGVQLIRAIVPLPSADAMKKMAFDLKNELENLFLVLGADIEGKALLTIMIDEALVKEKGLNAGKIIREAAREIKGGGGGQAFYATAGGKDPSGLERAIAKAVEHIGQHEKNG